MTDLNKTIEYTFKLVDSVTPAAGQMAQSADSAKVKVDDLEQSEKRLQSETARTGAALDKQQLSIVTQLTALMGFREAVSAVTGGIIGFGLVSDEAAQDLQKVNAAFSVFAGAVTTIKAVQGVMTTLNTATAIQGVLNTYNAVISSPAKMAGVGIALGATAGVAGALMLTQNSSSSKTTNITFESTTPQTAQSEVINLVTGGALRWHPASS